MSPFLSQLLMGFLFVTIGFISGAAVSYWLLEREKQKPKEELPQSTPEKTMPMEQAYEELLRIYRDRTSKKLLFKLEDRMIPTRVDLSKNQRTQVNEVIHEAMDWIGIQFREPAVPVAQPPVMVNQETAKATVAQPPALRPAPRPKESVKTDTKAPSRSFVEQIDEILQEMLVLTPFKDQSISLAEDPVDGVIAWVGNKRFIGIDAIDDPEIQKLIKIAVAKWEKSMDRVSRTTS